MKAEPRSILAELKSFRSKVPSEKLREWETPTGRACVAKIVQDWAILLAGHQLFVRYPGGLTFIAALFIMSWGQRGLSCLAHDSTHRNLVKNRKFNDMIANVFLAPPAMSTVQLQRHGHDLHHRFLGSSMDPDHGAESDTALKHYRTSTYSHKSIWTLFLYDVLDPVLFVQNALGSIMEAPIYLLSWWTIVSILTMLMEPRSSMLALAGFRVPSFFVLFHISRCTVSYAFYVLREIMDHSGLPSNSVLLFTRSSPWGNWFQKFLQPHDDNYHLLHHLLPKIPMSNLHEADSWLRANCPEYAAAHHYETYFGDKDSLFMEELHQFIAAQKSDTLIDEPSF